jgi:hypothetical protein
MTVYLKQLFRESPMKGVSMRTSKAIESAGRMQVRWHTGPNVDELANAFDSCGLVEVSRTYRFSIPKKVQRKKLIDWLELT